MNSDIINHCKSICTGCGLCCKLFLINLNEEEYRSGNYLTIYENLEVFDDFSFASEIGANLLARHDNGSCVYLVSGKCSIHDHKPEACLVFFCKGNEAKFSQMRKEIEAARSSR